MESALSFPSSAAFAYASAAQAVSLYSVVEIGPNMLAAVTSIIGAVVLIAQAYLSRKVTQARDVAHEAKSTAQQVEAVVEMRKEDKGPRARRSNDE